MNKLLVLLVVMICALNVYSQGYTYRKSVDKTEWIWLGSLPKPSSNPDHKLRVKIMGGYYTNYSLGETTYSIACRDGIQVNMSRQNGISNGGIYDLQIYESSNSIVFAEDYKLPSLSTVETHIKEHKHLPDIPSEAEVMENGISVGEMQAKLLQKIEELTLYTIQLEKRIKELENK